MMANTRVRTRDRNRVNPVKYTFRCELRKTRHQQIQKPIKWATIVVAQGPSSWSMAEGCSLEFLCGVVSL